MSAYPYAPFHVTSYAGAKPLLESDEWEGGNELWNFLFLSFDMEQDFTSKWEPWQKRAFLRQCKADLKIHGRWLAALMHLPADEAVTAILSNPKRLSSLHTYQGLKGVWTDNLMEGAMWAQQHPLDYMDEEMCDDFYPIQIETAQKTYDELIKKAKQKELK